MLERYQCRPFVVAGALVPDSSEWSVTLMERKMTREEVHAELRRILGEFVTFCENHDLRYFLAYGSLLGAVREGDIIPWDDDMDVLMPRPDYDRFLDLYSEADHPGFFLFAPGSGGYPSSWAKLVSLRTKFEATDHYFPEDYGVFMDVFPLDGIPKRLQGSHFRAVAELTAIRHKAYPKDKPHLFREQPPVARTAKRFVWQVLNQPRHLPSWIDEQYRIFGRNALGKIASRVPRSTLAGWAEAVASKFDYEKAPAVADYYGWKELDEAIIDRAHVDDFTYVQVGDLRVRAFAQPEVLLERWYGSDWQTPRPDFKPPHGEAFWKEQRPAT